MPVSPPSFLFSLTAASYDDEKFCSDPPEIELETNRVHSGINKEAHLTCRVQGNPEPIVSWYKDSNLLSESETVRFRTEEGRHTLILR